MSVKIAAVGDLHVQETTAGAHQQLFKDISENADILVLCGDLTNVGSEAEARILANDLQHCKIPVVGVLGNHDYHENNTDLVKSILKEAGVHILEDDVFTFDDIGFVGTKGFGGGFGDRMLGPFGEQIHKDFVQLTTDECLHLETKLAELDTPKLVAAMHYSPIPETLINEPPEIFPFLGSSRFAETLDRYNVQAIFHGHAHHGSPEGKTPKGTPVFNCALPLMRTINEAQPYKIFEL